MTTSPEPDNRLHPLLREHLRLKLIEAELAALNFIQASLQDAPEPEHVELIRELVLDLDIHDEAEQRQAAEAYASMVERLGLSRDQDRRLQRQAVESLTAMRRSGIASDVHQLHELDRAVTDAETALRAAQRAQSQYIVNNGPGTSATL